MTTALRFAVEGTGPRAEALAATARLNGWHLDAEAGPGVDVVAVVDPTAASAEAIVRHLEAGRHVIADPPWARTVAEADRVTTASRTTGRAVLHGEYPAHAPAFTALLAQVPSLGAVHQVEARFLAPAPPGSDLPLATVVRRFAPTPVALVLLACRRAGITIPNRATIDGRADARSARVRLGEAGSSTRISVTVGVHTGSANVCDVQVVGEAGVARAEILPEPSVERDGDPLPLARSTVEPPELELFGHLDQLRALATAIRYGAAPVTDAAFGREVLALVLDALSPADDPSR